jgi:type IV pilus assembly protein PilY1
MSLARLAGLLALVCHLQSAAQAPAVCAAAGPSAAWRAGSTAFVIETAARPASVRRHALAITPGGDASTGSAPAWDAAALLASASAPRNIFTFANAATLPFTWAGLPLELRALLDADGLGEDRIAYLCGERRLELGQPGGVFRVRERLLGDIVHSVPLIVGAPAPNADDGHDAFREQFKGRGVAVYVGANDGMLHAFSATDGAELFAYVPRTLIAALAPFGDPAFAGRAYVDGSAGQGDALIGGRWRTVLVSGMGMGARGVFALDITEPSAFSQGMGALWEFTEQDDPGIGYVQGAPQVVKLNAGANGSTPVYRHVAMVSSGAGNALFLLALDKPVAQPWRSGANYDRIVAAGADGLSAAGLVTSADGSAILAYAGDLQGQLWRFDLVARTAQRIFSARDDAGRAQPIVHAPKVVFAPGGGYLVLFGTGKLSEPADFQSASFAPQSMYAIHDKLEVPAEPVSGRARLAPRTLTGQDSYAIKGETIDYFAPGAKRGWYADFPNPRNGERAAGSPTVIGGAIAFNSVLPGADACAPAASRMYVLDALSGLALGADGVARPNALTGELAPLAAPLLEVGAGVGAPDPTGAAIAIRTFALIRPEGAAGKVTVSFRAGRLGWREVVNWQDLHDAATKK